MSAPVSRLLLAAPLLLCCCLGIEQSVGEYVEPSGGEGSGGMFASSTTGADAKDSTGGSTGQDTTGDAPLACGDPEVLACDDFEGGFNPSWTQVSVTRTEDFAHGGVSSARVSLPAPESRQQVGVELETPVTGGMLAIRTFLYIEGAASIDPWSVFFEIVQTPVDAAQRMSLDLRDGNGLLFLNFLTPDANLYATELLPRDEWVCVEVRIEISDDQGAVELLIDDVVELANGPGLDTRPDEGVSSVLVGGVASPESPGLVEYFIDDVIVATLPIGCG